MATLCARPTDCLAGRAFFGSHSHRGVRAAPGDAPAPRRPMQQQQGSQITARVSPPVSAMRSRPARGRANGRQQRRHPCPQAATPKPVMESVVILKRGEQIPPGLSVARAEKADTAVATDQRGALAGKHENVAGTAAVNGGVQDMVDDSVAAAKQSSPEAEKAGTVTFASQRGALAEKVGTVAATEERVEQAKEEDEPVAVAGQSGAPALSAEPVAATDKRKRGPDTLAKTKAETAERRARGTTTTRAEPVAHQTVRQAKEEKGRTPVAAAGAAAKLAPQPAYAGTSFAVAAPDPSELPIPVLLLKRRGGAARTIRAPGDDRAAPVRVAAAA